MKGVLTLDESGRPSKIGDIPTKRESPLIGTFLRITPKLTFPMLAASRDALSLTPAFFFCGAEA